MKSVTHDKIIKQVYSLFNHEENLTPYAWVQNKKYYKEVKDLLNSPKINKKLALAQISKAYLSIYNQRASKLLKMTAPSHVILNEAECYLTCTQKIYQILQNQP